MIIIEDIGKPATEEIIGFINARMIDFIFQEKLDVVCKEVCTGIQTPISTMINRQIEWNVLSQLYDLIGNIH